MFGFGGTDGVQGHVAQPVDGDGDGDGDGDTFKMVQSSKNILNSVFFTYY